MLNTVGFGTNEFDCGINKFDCGMSAFDCDMIIINNNSKLELKPFGKSGNLAPIEKGKIICVELGPNHFLTWIMWSIPILLPLLFISFYLVKKRRK